MADERTNENGVAYVTPQYVMRDQIASLDATHGKRWVQTPENATKVRKLLNGEILAPIPTNFKIAGADQLRVDAPQKYLTTYHQRNTLSKDTPRVERFSLGDAEPLKLESTKIEQIMQVVMDDRYPWRDSVDITLIEGVCLAIVRPFTAALTRAESMWEDAGKTKIRERYARNAQGKPRPMKRSEGSKEWRVSSKASKKVYDAETRDILSRTIPLDRVEVLGPTSFIPVFGPSGELDAVLVKRYWTLTEILKRKWQVDGLSGHISPDGPSTTHGADLANSGRGRFEVVELHAVDYQEDGPHPYCAYMVDIGKGRTRPRWKDDRSGEMVDGIVDFRTEYGLAQPHFAIGWGQHWAHPDMDKRAMPFPLPFAQSWLAIDAILTGATVWAWWRGFPTLIEQPNPSSPPDIDVRSESPDDEDEAVVEIAPLSLIRAKGTITELGTQGPSQIVMQLVEFMAASNEEQGPPNAAFGGDASSGFQASLSRAYAEDAMSDVRDGVLDLYETVSSICLELLSGMAKKFGPIPIQRLTPVPLGSRSMQGSRKRQILDLTEDLAGGLYMLEANYPPQPNLAKGQQWAEWEERGLILLREFREQIIGDEHPEIFEARLLKQRIQESPEFAQKVLAIIAQLEGDEQSRQQILALANQEAERGSDGVIRPMVPPDPNGLTGGGGMPSIAGSALGGAVAGPIGAATQAAAAGGSVPENVQMGPVG